MAKLRKYGQIQTEEDYLIQWKIQIVQNSQNLNLLTRWFQPIG